MLIRKRNEEEIEKPLQISRDKFTIFHWIPIKWDIWKFYVSNGTKTQPWQNSDNATGTKLPDAGPYKYTYKIDSLLLEAHENKLFTSSHWYFDQKGLINKQKIAKVIIFLIPPLPTLARNISWSERSTLV